MAGQFYYLITSLPSLDELGSEAPLNGSEYLDLVDESAVAYDLVKSVLLSDDLVQVQAFNANEIEHVSTSVLSELQVRGEEPLPDYLTLTSGADNPDAMWQDYFNSAWKTAESYGCSFLKAWIGFEVGLRNALITARARKLSLDPEEYYVARDLSGDNDFTSLVNEWSNAENPMAGMMVLDKARWDWLADNDGWFKFTYDELVVYGARLLLLKRWERLSGKVIAAS